MNQCVCIDCPTYNAGMEASSSQIHLLKARAPFSLPSHPGAWQVLRSEGEPNTDLS